LRLRSKQLIARFEKTALSQQDQGTIKYRSSRSKSAKQKMGVRHLLDDAGA
jgi:hypothetical protein